MKFHNTHNYNVTIPLIYLFPKGATISENPSVPHKSHRWTDFGKIVVSKNTQKAVFIPTNDEIFPLFRHENATTARRLHGEIHKFQCLPHAQCDWSIVECFKTKIIDFKSFSASSCCWCTLSLSFPLLLMKFLYVRREIVIRNILKRYRLLNAINDVACGDRLWMRIACKLSKWQQLSTVLIKINIIVFFVLYECCCWCIWDIYGK